MEAQLLIYPALDPRQQHASYEQFADGYLLTRSDMEFYWDNYLPAIADRSDPRAAPATITDFTGLPPTVVATAGFDPLHDEGREHARRLIAANVPTVYLPFPRLTHGFLDMAGRVPAARQAADTVVQSLNLLVNGTHQALCYFGYLLGYNHVHEALGDPDIRSLVIRYIDEEAAPTLRPIPRTDLNQYGRTVVERFSNPSIQDALTRICADTSDRIPKFLLPVAKERLIVGGRSPMCAAVVAAWARYAEGTDEQGKPIDVVDPRREELMTAARAQHSAPTAFIENRQVFGDIAESGALVEDYTRVLTAIHARGVRAALRELLQR